MRSNDDYSNFSYEENDSHYDNQSPNRNDSYNESQNLTRNDSYNEYNDENYSQDLIQFEEQIDLNSNPFAVDNSFNSNAEDRNIEREENLASDFCDFSPTCATPNKEPIVDTKTIASVQLTK